MGWVFVRAIERTNAHWKRKREDAHAIVEHEVKLRIPCSCAAGRAWLEEAARLGGFAPDRAWKFER